MGHQTISALVPVAQHLTTASLPVADDDCGHEGGF
jgi:hypothetical protein